MVRIKRITSSILFLICGLFLFVNISETLRGKVATDVDMVHSFYDLEQNSVDVLCVGSSHAYYGLQPNILWQNYGMTSYVMGSPQQTVASSYLLLKEMLNYQKPKVVVFEPYYFWYDGLYTDESRLRQAFDGLRFGEAKREMVETFLPELTWKEKLTYYLPFLKYHSRWSALKNEDFHSKAFLKGAKLDFGVKEVEDPGADVLPAPIPEVNKKYFEKIVELCRENEIALVAAVMPFGSTDEGYVTRQGVMVSLEEYMAQQEVPYLFYQKTGEAGIDFASDFRDETHLNYYGAEKMTNAVGSYLQSHYDLPDHRGDPVYASWQEDCEEYQRMVEEKIPAGDTEQE